MDQAGLAVLVLLCLLSGLEVLASHVVLNHLADRAVPVVRGSLLAPLGPDRPEVRTDPGSLAVREAPGDLAWLRPDPLDPVVREAPKVLEILQVRLGLMVLEDLDCHLPHRKVQAGQPVLKVLEVRFGLEGPVPPGVRVCRQVPVILEVRWIPAVLAGLLVQQGRLVQQALVDRWCPVLESSAAGRGYQVNAILTAAH